MRAALAIIATIAPIAIAACGNPAKDIIVGAQKFRDEMCACQTELCLMNVDAGWRIWLRGERQSLADRAESSADYFVDEHAAQREMEACQTRISKSLAPPPVDAAPPPPADEYAPLPPQKPISADAAIRSARTWAQEKRNSTLGSVRAVYVDADGVLDPNAGEIHIAFGIGPVDDPSRKTGAPVVHPDFSPQCFTLVLAKGTWTRRDDSCGSVFTRPVACMPSDIWKKALADTKTKDGLAKDFVASIEISTVYQGNWMLRVDDDMRKVHVMRMIPDDCPLAVEK